MSAPLSHLHRADGSPISLAAWRRWLFNRLVQWEEQSLARSLGLPVDRVIYVDVDHTALRSAGLRGPDASRGSDAS